jgi:hypothetical protein
VPAQVSLTYIDSEDRLHLRIASDGRPSHWWLTRRVALNLLRAWLARLEEVAPPRLELPWMPQTAQRELRQEHELSVDLDDLRREPKRQVVDDAAQLVSTVRLQVTSMETKLTLMAGQNMTSLSLTRKESHAMVEVLGLQARQAQWLKGMSLPEWIGRSLPRTQ